MALILGAVLAIQVTSGAYRREFVDPDEPAHFVTGVMVHDYLTTALGAPPMQFAENYYLRYPKVAIGHWPPGFYAVQGVWYSLVGVSKSSAVFLVGLVTAALTCCLYRRLRGQYGVSIAAVTVAVFLGQPLVRSQSIQCMSDMLASLGTFVAAFALSDFLGASRRRDAGAFALWSSLAILTRPTALALAAFVPFAVLLTRKVEILKNWKLWAAGATVGALTAPYYAWSWSKGMGLHTHGSVGHLVSAAVRIDRYHRASDAWFSVGSAALFTVSFLGIVSLVLSRQNKRPTDDASRRDALAAISLCSATLLFLYAAPIFSAPRYFLPFLVGLMILYARGLAMLLSRVPGPRFVSWLVVVCLATITVVTAPGHVPSPVTGYADTAASFGAPCPARVTLVSSNSAGEGAFVAERLLRDRLRSEFVLRASKVLSHSNWGGGRYETTYSTLDGMNDFLCTVPVHFIVIDRFAFRDSSEPHHHTMLKKLVAESPDQFSLVRSVAVEFAGQVHDDAIRVYENQAARGRSPVRIELDMKTSLGRGLSFEASE